MVAVVKFVWIATYFCTPPFSLHENGDRLLYNVESIFEMKKEFLHKCHLVYTSGNFAWNSYISKASIRCLTTLVSIISVNISSLFFSDSTAGRFLRTLSSTCILHNSSSIADGKLIQVYFDILFSQSDPTTLIRFFNRGHFRTKISHNIFTCTSSFL